ncbi:MAG: YtxH domain-containing protein [Candidatus Promineifilaceae bacterium]|nr:YtxH domain-containing protein [Candidatus Promineifilaceae bacterium]
MNDNSSDVGAFLAGFVIGGLVGAAAALILAPQSGSETRSQIMNKSNDLREAGGRRAHQARDSATTYVHDFSERASERGHQIQEQARIVLDTGKSTPTSNEENGKAVNEDDSGVESGAPTAE